jgi:hypothetical protein
MKQVPSYLSVEDGMQSSLITDEVCTTYSAIIKVDNISTLEQEIRVQSIPEYNADLKRDFSEHPNTPNQMFTPAVNRFKPCPSSEPACDRLIKAG